MADARDIADGGCRVAASRASIAVPRNRIEIVGPDTLTGNAIAADSAGPRVSPRFARP